MAEKMSPWRAWLLGSTLTENLRRGLWLYNAMVVLLLTGFFYVTQHKVIETMGAHSFLMGLPTLPMPADFGTMVTVLAFTVLCVCGRLYHRAGLALAARYLVLALEIIACIALMRSLSLAYDGVVLLVVADLMHRYDGHNISYLLAGAMLGLYFLADYNLIIFQGAVAPFDAYASYYTGPVRGVLQAMRSGLHSINLVLFALYLVMLIREKHAEKERIQSLVNQLEEANSQLRLYAAEAERTAETRERNRLAREIHDTLGHTLTGLAAGIDACIVLIDAAPEAAKAQLMKLCQVARHGLKDVRRSVKKLRPGDLERMPLRAALESMVREFAETTGMKVKLAILGWPEHLREDEEEVIYRIVQEGLTNASRHGHAQEAVVTIGTEPGRLYLMIADDGEGCAEVQPGFGLRHMQERLSLLHGRLRCWSDKGFTLEAVLPLGQLASKAEGTGETREDEDDKSHDSR